MKWHTAAGKVDITQSSGSLVVESEFTGMNLAFTHNNGAYQFRPIHFSRYRSPATTATVNITKAQTGSLAQSATMQIDPADHN